MIAISGCGCAPDSWVRWTVFGLLLAGGVAIWFAGRRRARRDGAGPSPATPSDETGLGRGWAKRGPNVAVAVMVVLAAGVAIVEADADVSLAALVIGAIVASAGMGVRVGRRAPSTRSDQER